MITIHKVKSASDAVQYYTRDNYYTTEEGVQNSQWQGKGAQKLGLSGNVNKDDFEKLINGKVGDQQLGRTVTDENGEKQIQHAAGYDLTFSASKSISLYGEVLGDENVKDAHDEAVKYVLDYVQENLAETRESVDGQSENVQTDNLIFATFRHNTSRELDPQTHTHCFVMNATESEDGKWRSLVSNKLYEEQRVLGALYTSKLAENLIEKGYKIEIKDTKGNFEIVGFSDEQLKASSTRRAQIEEHLNEQGLDISTATAEEKERATLTTRVIKKGVSQEKLDLLWKQKAQELDLNKEKIDKAQTERESLEALHAKEALKYAEQHLTEREMVFTRSEYIGKALERSVGQSSPDQILQEFARQQEKGEIIKLNDKQYTTKTMKKLEQDMVAQIKHNQNKIVNVLPEGEIVTRVDEIEKAQGYAFTQGQRDSIQLAVGAKSQYIGIQGLSGTGKTTMLKAVRKMSEEQGFVVRGMAGTNNAAKTLEKETGIESQTIAMFLMKEKEAQSRMIRSGQSPTERTPEKWVVDESSFVSQKQMSQIMMLASNSNAQVVLVGDKLQLKAIEAGKPFEVAQSQGLKTAKMTQINRQKTADLKKTVDIIVGRDAENQDKEIAELNLNRNGAAFEHLKETGRVIENAHNVDGALVENYLQMSKEERDRTLIITPFNRDRQNLTDSIRTGLIERGELGSQQHDVEILVREHLSTVEKTNVNHYQPGMVVQFGREYKSLDIEKHETLTVIGKNANQVVLRAKDGVEVAWRPDKHTNVEVYKSEPRQIAVGDVLRMTRKDEKVLNGTTGQIIMIGKHGDVRMQTKDGVVEFNAKDNQHFDHGYIKTVYASQGETAHRTILHLNMIVKDNDKEQTQAIKQMGKIFGDSATYVGVTRASHELMVYTNNIKIAQKMVGVVQDKTSVIEIEEKQREQGQEIEMTPQKQHSGISI